eukprot:CAMPEP_0176120056 /NCGR_PEP_ID=MMETSP0120_2-20121206/60378_1 /TAXON_ID=160619 /ORGANISM="Kryptoperidinium foliaceum, Strain CCMP 1326" /LENGTH=128 /DNA_ID=CAMNT_0017454489 /DNA_START=99 /DNA_END=485 /DNA_ORIENTATION=+
MKLPSVFLVGSLTVLETSAFAPAIGRIAARSPATLFGTRLGSSVDDQEAIQCFIVNSFEVDEEGVEPEIVCTSDPDNYAWFNGINKDDMKPADCERDGYLECVEGASPRGIPEWECKKKNDVEEEPWQ